jgi:rhodanese-related sulfurtransferase
LRSIAPETLHYLLHYGSTLALLDVRELGEYNVAHIPGASALPRREIEFRLERLVPSLSVQLVVCDDDGRRASLAAATAERMGYERVAVLEGGLNRWATLGFPVEWGLNVPSKDFGEMLEARYHVPTIEPLTLAERARQGEKFLILDTRTPEEFSRSCIPGGRNVPGGELVLRIMDLVKEQPDATVVVNCAGRTRSIIGTRLLQRMGLAKVVGLKNGTSGWVLAGLSLQRDPPRLASPRPSPQACAVAETFASRLAAEDGVRLL